MFSHIYRVSALIELVRELGLGFLGIGLMKYTGYSRALNTSQLRVPGEVLEVNEWIIERYDLTFLLFFHLWHSYDFSFFRRLGNVRERHYSLHAT